VTIAVTGASGFVGRHVLAELAGRGVHVLAASRAPERVRVPPGVEVMPLDLRNAAETPLARLAAADLVVHLAWDGLPNFQALRHFEEELPGQYGFLRALVRRGVRALLVAGTCAEYGLQSGELSEECATSPASPYGYAKDALRRQLQFLAAEHPFALTWMRLFYMYGEGQPTTSLYPQMQAAVARGETTFDMSGGEQLRDYLPVREVARLVAELALRRGNDGVVNVCAGRPISVRRLAEAWIAEHGWNLRLNLGRYPYPADQPMAFWGSRRKLETVLQREA
jgi:dTDP-6-deoxy-L-talose 4-dehydrogenase (NAD+)